MKNSKYFSDLVSENFKQRETYISILSHDLQIPTLAQIRALELLLSEKFGKINGEQKEMLNLTLNSCKHMYNMLLTILTAYKYENEEVCLDLQEISATGIVDECIAKYDKKLQQKNIKFKVISEDSSCLLLADRLQIEKAFESLIMFCIDSAIENSVVRLKFEACCQNIKILIEFQNPNFTEKTLINMLGKYTTSGEKLDKVGSSLNLYLARQIINAHQGVISTRKNGISNIFNIELPSVSGCEFSTTAC